MSSDLKKIFQFQVYKNAQIMKKEDKTFGSFYGSSSKLCSKPEHEEFGSYYTVNLSGC